MTAETATHTPGPWEINAHVDDRWAIVRTGVHDHNRDVATVDYTGGDAEQVARLIAAAPALLAAAQKAIDNTGGHWNGCQHREPGSIGGECWCGYDALCAAIDKATP